MQWEEGMPGTALDSDCVLTAERHREMSLQSFGTETGDERGALFHTCLSGNTDATIRSPTSSRKATKKRVNLQMMVREQVQTQMRMGAAADALSEGSSHRGNVRGFLNVVYDEQQRCALGRHQWPRELDTHQTPTPTSLKVAVPVASSDGTPTRRHRSHDRVSAWAFSRHLNLEQLQTELEERLHSDAHFTPELHDTRTDENEEGEARENEIYWQPKQLRQMVTESTTGRSVPEQSKLLPNQMEYHAAGAQWGVAHHLPNDDTIELSERHDATKRADHSEALRQAEERMRMRRQRAEMKWRAKELSECTFHPQIAPTSAALFRDSEQAKDSVFHRLYQPKKARQKAQREKQDQGQQQEQQLVNKSRGENVWEGQESLAREERDCLRELCGAMTAGCAADDTFELFLQNVLGSSSGDASIDMLTGPLGEESTTLTRGRSDKQQEERRYRLECFDKFLMRQNLYHESRSQNVRNLEKVLTPSFKPEITENSIQIAKDLLARTPVTKSDACNASALALAVKKHRSPYVDSCTFKPKITAISSAMTPRGVEDMFKDGARRQDVIKAAADRALAKELQHPFNPSLNKVRNTHVESLLNPKNYPLYKERLKQQRERIAQTRQEEAEMKEREELNANMFRPQTSRKPAYIARMASSFALVRQQYGEI